MDYECFGGFCNPSIHVFNTRDIKPSRFPIMFFNMYDSVWFFVCLVFFCPTREFFTHVKTSTLSVKGCKFWPPARHLRPLSSEGYLAPTVTRGIRLYSNLVPSVWQWSCHYLCLRLRSVAGWDSNTQPSAFMANALTNCATAAATLTVCQSPTHLLYSFHHVNKIPSDIY